MSARQLIAVVRGDARLAATDVALVGIAYATALLLRFDGTPPAGYWLPLVAFSLVIGAAHVVVFARVQLYGRVWEQAGTVEAWWLLVASALLTAGATVGDLLSDFQHRALPLSVPVNAGLLALVMLGGSRFASRLGAQHRRETGAGVPVLLVGPAVAARGVLEQLGREHGSGRWAAAVVTDESDNWGRRLSGVPLVGPISQLAEYAELFHAEQVLLLPGALPAQQAREIAEQSAAAGLSLRALPTLLESITARQKPPDARDLALPDLLGRAQVQADDAPVRRIITGHRVLITGAGGSIGSEIARQVADLEPSELVLLDHDETHLHDTMAALHGRARPFLGDIRDELAVERLMQDFRPEIVFHAAAHKHVPILEAHPTEAVRTNVHGTDVLVQAAMRAGTQRFVAISTDKAVAPSCVMGASKRLAEQLVVHRAGPGRQYCAVRFGNVLGSRGSVVPTFVQQVRAGGPVTVTHPDMTRYFMTTQEAVTLVLQAGARAAGGEVFLLDMGEPVRILDLAERIIELSGLVPGQDIPIVFSGLRPGEKMTEVLASEQETVVATAHPKVLRVDSCLSDRDLLVLGVDELVRRAWQGDEDATRRLLFELARMPEELLMDGEVLELASHRIVVPRPQAVAR